MISRYGLIKAADRAVNGKVDAMGYRIVGKIFRKMTLEAVIVAKNDQVEYLAVEQSGHI